MLYHGLRIQISSFDSQIFLIKFGVSKCKVLNTKASAVPKHLTLYPRIMYIHSYIHMYGYGSIRMYVDNLFVIRISILMTF